MSDKTWGERAGDAWDLVADIVRFLFVMAVVLSPVAGIAYCVVNHISFDDISPAGQAAHRRWQCTTIRPSTDSLRLRCWTWAIRVASGFAAGLVRRT